MSKFSVRAKAGMCFNGAERDQGTVTHAVPCAEFPSWETAICGTVPGSRGNGWKDPIPDGEVTCKRCKKQIEEMEEVEDILADKFADEVSAGNRL